MKQFMLLICFALSLAAFAQEDLEPQMIQENPGLSLKLPFYVSLDGNVSFLKNHAADAFVFSPLLQFSASFRKARYLLPERVKEFSLVPRETNSQWLEIHVRKLQAGAGVGFFNDSISLGLYPYKGATQRLVRTSRDEKMATLALSLMPKKLQEIQNWNVGDYGTFDTYGGIQLQASASLGMISLGSAKFSVQNEFRLEIKKLSDDQVSLAIYEGGSKKRQITLGPVFANASLGAFSGKRLGAEFLLDLGDQEHHRLFQEALRGKLALLQETLPHDAQSVQWSGSYFSTSYGIPLIIGRDSKQGSFDVTQNNQTTTIRFHTKKNAGLILPRRDIHRFLYFTDRQMVLFWSSEMKKVSIPVLEKHYLSIGRRIGIQGFDQEIDQSQKVGTTLSQLGITLTRDELNRLSESDLPALNQNYLERCEELELNCVKAGKRQKTLSVLASSLKQPWNKGRARLAELLVKHPALIHSLIKTLKLNKKGYFYFLSEKFRSEEGMSPIAI